MTFTVNIFTYISDGMTADDLFFKWDDTSNPGDLRAAVAVGEELIMSQFAVDNYTVDEITASYVTGLQYLSALIR